MRKKSKTAISADSEVIEEGLVPVRPMRSVDTWERWQGMVRSEIASEYDSIYTEYLARLPDEPPLSYRAFLEYVMHDPPNFTKFAKLIGRSHGWLAEQASRYDWLERKIAFENAVRRARFKYYQTAVLDLRLKIVNKLANAFNKALNELESNIQNMPPRVMIEYARFIDGLLERYLGVSGESGSQGDSGDVVMMERLGILFPVVAQTLGEDAVKTMLSQLGAGNEKDLH